MFGLASTTSGQNYFYASSVVDAFNLFFRFVAKLLDQIRFHFVAFEVIKMQHFTMLNNTFCAIRQTQLSCIIELLLICFLVRKDTVWLKDNFLS